MLPATPPATLVAVVADVAVFALPDNEPVNVVEVTDVNPANVVDVPPRAIFVEPTVTELFVNAPFGMLVNEAPEPLNVPAVIVPAIVTALGSETVTAPVEAETVIWLVVPANDVTGVFAVAEVTRPFALTVTFA